MPSGYWVMDLGSLNWVYTIDYQLVCGVIKKRSQMKPLKYESINFKVVVCLLSVISSIRGLHLFYLVIIASRSAFVVGSQQKTNCLPCPYL